MRATHSEMREYRLHKHSVPIEYSIQIENIALVGLRSYCTVTIFW